MELILPCVWCTKKISPPKGFNGSFHNIQWVEVDGTNYTEKEVDKDLHVRWRNGRTTSIKSARRMML